MGPLLFTIYINDIVAVSSQLSFVLFADDINLFASHKSLDNLIKIFNDKLDNAAKWIEIKKLSLNVTKTNLLFFPQ